MRGAVACWSLLAATVAVAALLLLNAGWYSLRLGAGAQIVVRRGAIELGLSRDPIAAHGRDGWLTGDIDRLQVILSVVPRSFIVPTVQSESFGMPNPVTFQPMPPIVGITVMSVPLAVPTGLLGLVTVLLWRKRTRRWPPGHCRSCGYDLTGAVSDRCSECGAAIRRGGQPLVRTAAVAR